VVEPSWDEKGIVSLTAEKKRKKMVKMEEMMG
jgi:hypothetical protein